LWRSVCIERGIGILAKDEWFFNYVLFPSYVDIFDKKGNKYAPVLNMYVKKVVFPK
jgi:hypothetical protein